MGLILHCGAQPVSEKVVKAVVPTPKSKTHEPLAHGDFIEMTRQCLRDLGIEAGKGQYGLTPDGENMFGLIELPKTIELPFMENIRDRLAQDYKWEEVCKSVVAAVDQGICPPSMLRPVLKEYEKSESEGQRELFQKRHDANRLIQAFTHVNQKEMGRAQTDFGIYNRIAERSKGFTDIVLESLPEIPLGCLVLGSRLMDKVRGSEYDSRYIIGLRNSNSMKFRAGWLIAEAPFVCDNLAFCGSAEVHRKHTLNIHRDMPALMHEKLAEMFNINLENN